LPHYKEAKTMHRQMLALKEEVLSKEHPDALTTVNKLGGTD
jgi:hypothetical protein